MMSIRAAGASVFRKAPKEHVTRSNPFPGARPFRTDESTLFYGRAREVPELSALVRAQRFCLLYAPSGAGKSSLINAGLLQRVGAEQGDGPRPGVAELDVIGIAKVHPGAVRGPAGWPDAAEVPNVYVTAALNSLEKDNRSTHTTFSSFLAARPRQLDEFDDPVPRLLVLDQFEEILEPFGRKDWLDCRADFFAQLDKAMRDDPALHVLVAIREDHLATIERLTARMSVPFQARYRLDKLTTRSAKQAMEGPARASGLPFDEGVVDKLIEELALRRIDEFKDAIPDEFIEPGQLQVVCNRLWARADADPTNREPGGTPAIRAEHVTETGGVGGALRRYYDEAVTEVVSGRAERRLRRFFEKRLITSRYTRQLVRIDPTSTTTEGIPNDVLSRMESEYGLVRREQRGGESYWELSHDGFIQPIRKANFDVWDRRRIKMERVAFGVVLGTLLVVLAVFAIIRSTDDETPTAAPTSTLDQYLVNSGFDSSDVGVPIDERAAGSSIVVELVQPPGSAADFELVDEDGALVAPQESRGDLRTFTIPDSTNYFVDVSNLSGQVGINVRTGAELIELPPDILLQHDVVASLSAAGLKPTSGPTCSDLADLDGIPTGDALRIIDVDRRWVAGVEGVLTVRGNYRSKTVATGTAVIVETFNGESC